MSLSKLRILLLALIGFSANALAVLPEEQSRPVAASIAHVPLRVRPLELSRAPTNDELISAGQLGGPLFPTHELKDAERDQVARWAFGKAIEQWNRHEYSKAVTMFRRYLEDFPDSPWAAEALLHIGCDASYNGRYSEAEAAFRRLLAEHEAKAHTGARMLANKARQRLALLKVEQNNLSEAARHFQSLYADSPDWRHRTYASHWLQRLSRYTAAGRALVNCGAEALAYALEGQGRAAAAAQVRTNVPASLRGYNLADLANLAARHGFELAALSLSVAELRNAPLPAILHITARQTADKGHYWVLDRAEGDQFEFVDPQSQRRFRQSATELAKEWKGSALVFSNGQKLPGRQLELREMEAASGGCCGVPRKEDDLGCTGSHGQGGNQQGTCTTCGGDGAAGFPIWSVNMINMNLFVSDTPLWYDPPVGPAVSIQLSYNSQSAIAYNEPFGNKWQLNYASSLVVDTSGTVLVYMPDGARDTYTPDRRGGYVRPYQVYNTLTCLGPNSFELRLPDDTIYAYGIPPGTDSLQPFLLEIRDTWGQKVTFGYDFEAKLTTITDAQGKITRLSYDARGLVFKVTDPFERSATFQYDADSNLVKITDMGGYWATFTYDADSNLRTLGSARGTWTFLIEPSDGIDNGSDPYPEPGATMWENYRITVADPLGQFSEYYYDGYSGYAWYIGPRGYMAWNGPYNNNLRSGAPAVTYSFSSVDAGRQGEISDITYPEGNSVSFEYDSHTGNPTAISDGDGNTLTCGYNAMGRVTWVEDPSGTKTDFGYAANGVDLTSMSNDLGLILNTYDSHHQITALRDQLNNTTTFTYNNFGQLTSLTEPVGATTYYEYDDSQRLARILRDAYVLESITYDEYGRVRTRTDEDGLALTFEYNLLDRVTRVTYPDGKSVNYVYSDCCPGLIESVTDRAGRTTRFTYDALKRLTEVRNPEGGLTHFDYDASGNRVRVIDPNGSATSYAYDFNGRVVQKTYADGSIQTYKYSPTTGLLTSRTGPRGIVTTYEYDQNHRLTLRSYSDGTPGMTNRYDEFGRISQRLDGLGTHTFTYDSRSLMTSYDGPWPDDLVQYVHDRRGNLISIAPQKGGAVSYEMDALSRVSAVNVAGGSYQYAYAGGGALVRSLTRPNGGVTSFAYDALNRLTGAATTRSTGQGISQFSSIFGPQDLLSSVTVSNFLSAAPAAKQLNAYAPNALNQVTPVSEPAFVYDAAGNLVRGLTSERKPFIATYDGENRLASLVYTNRPGETRRLEYIYDGHSLLRQLKEYQNLTLVSETRLIRTGFSLVQERDGNNSVTRGYAWGQGVGGGVGGLLDVAQQGQHYSYVYDGHGSPILLLDSSQSAAAAYAYDPFGRLAAKTGTVDQPFRFSTMLYDEGTGLSIYPYRVYSSTLGRWLTRDPMGEASGPNAYEFVRNNPLKLVDPLGLDPWIPDPAGRQGFDPSLGSNKGTVATVVCDGAQLSLLWKGTPRSNCATDCVAAHEMSHAEDMVRSNPGLLDACAAVSPGTAVVNNDWEAVQSEIRAYTKELECLKKKEPGKRCKKTLLDDAIKNATEQLNRQYRTETFRQNFKTFLDTLPGRLGGRF